MKNILKELYAGQLLTEDKIYQLMKKIGEGEYSAIQISAFLSALNMRPVSVNELRGMRRAMLDLCLPVDFEGRKTIDLCGTGGDGKDTFNISTLSAFVVAGAEIPVTKHGNYGVSSHCGSSNVLEALGIKFTNDIDRLKKQLEQANITILHAPLFHPAMKHVAPVRREMQIKTIFNILGPLSNPCKPQVQVTGVFNLEVGRLYYYLLQESTPQFAVIHALDGYDEISLTGETKIFSHEGERCYTPQQLGFKALQADQISGGKTIEDAKNIFLQVLKNEATIAQKEVILANAAVCISIYKNISIHEGIDLAKESLESGKAYQALKKLIDL
ncbi:MAG: anthranilate phosphoribosyltransferase [Chitinophagales bacterium]|nr:anthranilate phosphoribosyltransferase [Chitinophagales bacterium]MCZ2392420.1 anthranilate phosphoribosyltransferase [Chitinophagales bacterium]